MRSPCVTLQDAARRCAMAGGHPGPSLRAPAGRVAGRDERMVAAQSNQRMILPQGAHQVGTPVPLEKPDIHFGRRGGSFPDNPWREVALALVRRAL